MTSLRDFLTAAITGQPLPPLDGADPGWKGADPASPEWQALISARPFISFPIHPLPPNVQKFIDENPDLDAGERDAISDLLEQLHRLPPGFCIVPDGGEFIVHQQ